MPGNGLSGWRWEKARATVLRNQIYCSWCGDPVDHTLKAPDPLSPSVDHIIPLSRGGDPYDLANLALQHLGCNSRKGNGVRRKHPTSRQWLR